MSIPKARTQFADRPMWIFGHAWQVSTAATAPGGRWWELVVQRLGMGTATLRAVTGKTAGDNACLMLSDANPWEPRTRALIGIANTLTDVLRPFSGTAEGTRAFCHAWRAMLSILTSDSPVASNTVSFTFSDGGWKRVEVSGTAAVPTGQIRNSTGGEQWFTERPGDHFEFTFSGPDVDVFLVAKAEGSGLVAFTEGSETLGAIDLRQSVAQEVPALFRIRDRGEGVHTIRGTLAAGASAWVDSYRVPLSHPAPIIVYGEPPANWSAFEDAPARAALLVELKRELTVICAEFASVHYVDLDRESWDSASMLSADGLHPNDAGSAWIATQLVAELESLTEAPGLKGPSDSLAYVAPAAPALLPGGHSGQEFNSA